MEHQKKTNVTPVSGEVQRRLAAGVQYHMKIVIRGDRNTGKSQLFERLRGGSFGAEYKATEQIETAAIDWTHRGSGAAVLCELIIFHSGML